MYKVRISNIIDIVLTSGILFLLFYCWIRFYTKNSSLSIFISVLITFLLVFLIFFCKKKKSAKKQISLKQKKMAVECATQLKFSGKNNVKKFFLNILKDKYKTQNKTDGVIIFEDNKTTFFVVDFDKDIFSSNELASVYSSAKKYGANELIICAISFDDNTKNLSKSINNLKITLLDAYETYAQIIEPSKQLPAKVVDTEKAKLTFKQLMSYIISRERTKNYLLLGLVLIFSSFFVLFKIYYLVFGSFLLFMALLTRILPHKQKTTISSIHL